MTTGACQDPGFRRSPRAALALIVAAFALMAFSAFVAPPPEVPGRAAAGSTRPVASRVRPAPPATAAVPVAARRAPVPAPVTAGPPGPTAEALPADPATLVPEEIVFVPGDPAASFAVVDGRAVRRGDRVGGRLVHEVTEHAVHLGEEGEIVLPKGR